MGFDIGKFQREYKRMAAEKREAEVMLADFEGQKVHDIAAAVALAVRPLNEQLTACKTNYSNELRQKELELQANAASIDGLKARRGELDGEVAELQAQVEDLTRDRDRWRHEYDQQLPAVLLAEGKARDLEAVLKRHEDRMHRKDRDAASAILNRKVIAQVAPARNRG